MYTYIQTGVPGVLAQHLTVTAQATHRQDDLTLVWSTRPVRCCETQPVIPMDDPPPVWDATGCGDWDYAPVGQCGQCGQLLVPFARLLPGQMSGEDLERAARWVANDLAKETAARRAELRADLERQARWVAEHGDLRHVPELDSMAEPGVGRYTDLDGNTVLVAWDYDPAGDGGFIEVEVEVDDADPD